MAGFFVTGTDTEVGKTYVTVQLIRCLVANGYRTVGMKPIASGGLSGQDGRPVNEDVLQHANAANVAAPLEWRNPYAFSDPVSPHLAAARANTHVQFSVVSQAYQHLAALAEVVLVEGAGGWLAPVSENQTMSDLAIALNLPVILVVGVRLGCLNHAMLTVESILARNVPLAGWVANCIDPVMPCQDENIAYLSSAIAAPRLGTLHWNEQVEGAETVFDTERLKLLF